MKRAWCGRCQHLATRTFTIAKGTKPADWRVAGDVSVTFDNRGHAFLCYLAFDRLGTTSYWAHNAGRNGIFVRRSLDGGKTWEPRAVSIKSFPTGRKPARVNNDPIHDGKDQFFQWMALDPVTGDIYVQFYDRRADPSDLRTRFTLARSTDAGRAFANYAWTRTPFDSQGAFLGDYTWITAYDHRVFGVWTETVRNDKHAAGVAARSHMTSPQTTIRAGVADFSRVH